MTEPQYRDMISSTNLDTISEASSPDAAAGLASGNETKILSSPRRGLSGKTAAMITFSPYPFDTRPRRAVDALISEGMSVDLICQGDDKSPGHEQLKGINIVRVPIAHRRAGK